MKKFIGKALLYFCIAAALSYAGLVLLGPLYWHTRVPLIKMNDFNRAGSGASLVLGSSHSVHGINCTILGDNYYNLASFSQGLDEDLAILKHFKSKKIKSVILPISYFSNFFSLAKSPTDGERVRMFDYEHGYNLQYRHDLNYLHYKFTLFTQIAKTVTRLPNWVKGISGKGQNAFDRYGTETDTCDLTKYDISDSLAAFNRHNVDPDFSVRNPMLDSIISYCSKNDIKLNIVVFPFTAGYQRAVKNKGSGFDQFLNTLKAQQSPQLKFIDCRNLFTRNETIYFRDADHLSPCGRDSLSAWLRKEVLK